ncbi:MAG: ABC transporter ATP-binding protein [Enterococcus sp.]
MITLDKISLNFGKKNVLNNISLSIQENDFICIHGKSGSGKTTLLNVIGLIEHNFSGELSFEGKHNPSQKEILHLRKEKIGYLFQNYALVEEENVFKNLEIAFHGKKVNRKSKLEKMEQSLQEVGLGRILFKKVYELSGGEQQRVALARLTLKNPKYILADEPTGNLDWENAHLVFEKLKELHQNGATVVIVSHDPKIINESIRTFELK